VKILDKWPYILLLAIFAVLILFALPVTRPYVESFASTVKGALTGALGNFQQTEFYNNIVMPNISYIAFISGILLTTLIAIFAVRGYFSFIRNIRRKSEEMAGFQTQPTVAYTTSTPQPVVQAQPVVKKEEG